MERPDPENLRRWIRNTPPPHPPVAESSIVLDCLCPHTGNLLLHLIHAAAAAALTAAAAALTAAIAAIAAAALTAASEQVLWGLESLDEKVRKF